MKTVDALVDLLGEIDGRGYKAYKALRDVWAFSDFVLHIDHVQGDPFAMPSRVRALVPAATTGLSHEACSTPSRRIGVACLLARRFGDAARAAMKPRGIGKSGVIEIEAPGQEVVAHTAVIVADDGGVEARFTVGLPASGRRVSGTEAVALLTEDVPRVVRASLREQALGSSQVLRHALANEDADALRDSLEAHGWVAFVADGSVLPRRSGIDDRPLGGRKVVPFTAPGGLAASVHLPHAGRVTGMALPRGVSLVVGGGYHGKSTLLRAVEAGVYNHCPGDGRELVVSETAAVRIRAEEGRSVAGVDISAFIDGLPQGQDTNAFCTPNASGSTSQAASIVEALEVGASALLIDEDTAATNFMIRDRRMQSLVPKSAEPITPFVDRVRALWEEWGVSSVIVLGGSGDYLDVADTVVAMKEFRPHNVTDEARSVAEALPTGRQPEAPDPVAPLRARAPVPGSVDARRGRRDVHLKVHDRGTLVLGRQTIDLSAVSQLVSRAQTRAVGRALVLARERFMDGQRSLGEICDLVLRMIETGGLDALDERRVGDLAAFRTLEFAAALNRLRTLEVTVPPR